MLDNGAAARDSVPSPSQVISFGSFALLYRNLVKEDSFPKVADRVLFNMVAVCAKGNH